MFSSIRRRIDFQLERKYLTLPFPVNPSPMRPNQRRFVSKIFEFDLESLSRPFSISQNSQKWLIFAKTVNLL